MAVKMRLARAGSKKRPYYHIVIADAAAPRDGKFIDVVGAFNPMLKKDDANRVKIDAAKAEAWLKKGAQPTDRVLRFLDARTYAEADVRANAAACVDILKRCHGEMGRRITGQGAIFWVFQILRDYGATLVRHGHRHAPDVPRLMKIVDQLEAAQLPLPIVFGHHDLLPGNFIDDGERLWLIDFQRRDQRRRYSHQDHWRQL